MRVDLPVGSVTLLFTDIEGSTRLIEVLGEAGYVHALAEHRRLLRAAFSAYGGVEVDTQGDAFLYAFADPRDAAAAAIGGQGVLESGPVLVRMGLHTGDLQLTGEGYAGLELHRAARIAASGHGGQVVVSAATRALIDGDLTDLGEHRLKDFDEPVALFQLGEQRFPPLKTISNTNLPRPASSFVGRQRERDELVAMLCDGTRLVTLSGPGGSGKTRLSVEAATELVSEFKAGVFWVGLSALRDPALVTDTIAETLGAKDGLAEHVGERELLLVLDNFEQVADAAPALGALLRSCPKLRAMVTSRELLRIDGEVDYPVPPLAESEAVELFCRRSGLEADKTVAELCRRLDNNPLAVELAAARTRVLSPAQVLDRLSNRLDLLKGGRDADPRQQTLRATIEWSHDLLDQDEQQLFARLAVFRGGCTLEAAEQVADADIDIVQSLLDKSLLRHTGGRFWMLETIREYARERLSASGEEDALLRRHALTLLELLEQVRQQMDDEERAVERTEDQVTLLERIDAEHDNTRAVLEWARDQHEEEILLRLTWAAKYAWGLRDRGRQELKQWLELAVERGTEPAQTRAHVLVALASLLSQTGELSRAGELLAEARDLAERDGDESLPHEITNTLAWLAYDSGDLDTAAEQFAAMAEQARQHGDTENFGKAAVNLSDVLAMAHDYETALEHAGRALDAFRSTGDDSGVGVALENSGWCFLGVGDPARAQACFLESLDVARRLGAPSRSASAALGLGASLIAGHEEEHGTLLLGAATAACAELGLNLDVIWSADAHEDALSSARLVLGDENFATVWTRGEAMPLEQAITSARGCPP